MKILHITPAFFPSVRYGGPIWSVLGLSKALVSRGHQVGALTTSSDGRISSPDLENRTIDFEGIQVRFCKTTILHNYFYAPAMNRIFKSMRSRWDIIHIHCMHVWPTALMSKALRNSQFPYVISPRGMMMKSAMDSKSSIKKHLWMKLWGDPLISNASGIHFTSQIEAEQSMHNRLKLLNRAYKIPNGFDENIAFDDVVNEGVVIEKEVGPYILYLGRIYWNKGIDRLIKALSSTTKLQLIVAGPDNHNYQAALEMQVKKLGLENRVHFVGAVYGERKRNIIAGAKAMCLLSGGENFGNTILESLALNMPVIVSSDSGAAEVVAKHHCGFVVQTNSLDVERALDYIELQNEVYNDTKSNCVGAIEEYQWSNLVSQYEGMYESCLKSVVC
jgi:glycosyltransferase involved in cell wall biosynthesis